MFSEDANEAISALLGNKASAYGSEGTSSVGGVAPFDRGKVSLPSSAASAPLLTELLCGEPLDAVKGFETCVLNSTAEQEVIDSSPSVRPRLYFDPILKSNPKK